MTTTQPWLFALLVVVGCSAQPFRGPEQGGARWTEARSQHVRLWTSQDDDRARSILAELETAHALLETVAFPSRENPPGVSELVVLPAEEFDTLQESGLVGQPFAGLYAKVGVGYAAHPLLVTRGDLGEADVALFEHELTHHFTAFHFPAAPPWLHEGLATFWSTLEVKGNTAYFGGAVRAAYKPTPFRELLTLGPHEFYDDENAHQNYAGATALAYQLYFKHRDVLALYLRELKSGQMDERAAWSKATDGKLDALEESFNFFFEEQGTQAELPAPHVEAQVDLSELSAVDTHLLWASIWESSPRTFGRARAELEAALRADPFSAEALAMRASLRLRQNDQRGARKDIEKALELAATRSKVLASALEISLVSDQELSISKNQLAHRLQKFQLNARQLLLLGEYFGTTGQADRGVETLARAVRIDSSCVDCYAAASELFAARGEWPNALGALKTSLALRPEQTNARQRKRLRELESEAVEHAK